MIGFAVVCSDNVCRSPVFETQREALSWQTWQHSTCPHPSHRLRREAVVELPERARKVAS